MRVPSILPLLVLLAAGLAGCSGGDEEPGTGPQGSLASTSTAPPPPPLPTSDTLHFLAAPEMAPALPGDSTESSTPVTVADFDGPGGQGPPQGAEWRHQVERPTNVSAGEVRIWIEVKETLFQSPDSPVRPTCSWTLTVNIGADNSAIVGCIQEPPGPVNPGVKELTFQLSPASPIELEANETITVRLERAGFSLSPNNAVDAKSGSADRDSRITLTGLKEPIRED